MSNTVSSPERDTNSGFHAPARNDATASWGLLGIIILLLAVGTVVAVIAYKHYNSAEKFPPATEQPSPPLNP